MAPIPVKLLDTDNDHIAVVRESQYVVVLQLKLLVAHDSLLPIHVPTIRVTQRLCWL